MIRVHRGPEPLQLIKVRRRKLARQILGRYHGTPPRIEGYDCIKRELYQALAGKCVFCERHTGEKGSHVEHFRPKECADPDETQPSLANRDHSRYWWLSWTWENLLFACSSCNSGYKRNFFPLMPGTQPLPGPRDGVIEDPTTACYDLGRESAVLIDPGREDPLEHIEWRPEDPDAPYERLRWRPFHKTERGRRTLTILGLHESIDHVNDHVRRCVLGPLRQIWRECDRGDVSRMRELWEELLPPVFSPAALYQAASYDALRFLVPRWFREQHGLSDMQRPGARQPPPPPGPVFHDPPRMAELPSDLRIQVRAGLLARSELRGRLLLLGAWTEEELAELLDG